MVMGVSFRSTLPSLLPLVPVSSITTATRCPTHAVSIRCNKIDAAEATDHEDRFRRRDILKCIGASVGMGLIVSSGGFVETASAANLIQRRQRSEFQSNIKGTLYEAIKKNPDIVPSLLTLALNDAITYDKATKTGGPNGSIRFRDKQTRKQRACCCFKSIGGSKEGDRFLLKGWTYFVCRSHPIRRFAILTRERVPFTCAAQSALKSTFLAAAIRKCGGNEEKGNLLYSAYGTNGQWGLFDKQFGRSATQQPDPEGRVPLWEKATVQEMKDEFSAIGFGPRQLAVLSAFLGPDQTATEALLAADPQVKPWVEKYQRSRETVSQTDYEVDLITTLNKLSSLGQQINYEAYTYPTQKVDLSKTQIVERKYKSTNSASEQLILAIHCDIIFSKSY